MSGLVGGQLNLFKGETSWRNHYPAFITGAHSKRALENLSGNYHGEELAAEVSFDPGGIWCSRLQLPKQLYSMAQVIASRRHMPWTTDSFEQMARKDAFAPASIFDYQPGGSIYLRAEGLANGQSMLGFAGNALKEAHYSKGISNLILLQYEPLVNDTAGAMKAIYAFLCEPAFKHDSDNIRFDAKEFHACAGTPYLHTVRRKMEARERVSVLPPDVFRRFENDAFRRDPSLNPVVCGSFKSGQPKASAKDSVVSK